MKAFLRPLVFALLLTVWLPSPSRGDTLTVPDSDAWKYVGQNVAVEGIVSAVSTSKETCSCRPS
jgi:hypothetical protein